MNWNQIILLSKYDIGYRQGDGLKEHNVKAWSDLSPERKGAIKNLSLRIDVLTKTISCKD